MGNTIDNIIGSIDDLKHNRSKRIAESEGLIVERIPQKYLELIIKDLIPYGGNLEKYIKSQQDCSDTKEKLACGVVINDELTKSRIIQFVIPRKPIIKNRTEERYFELAKNNKGIFERGKNEPIEPYKKAAEKYEEYLNLINKYQEEMGEVFDINSHPKKKGRVKEKIYQKLGGFIKFPNAEEEKARRKKRRAKLGFKS